MIFYGKNKSAAPQNETAPIKVFFRFAATQLQKILVYKSFVNAKRYTLIQEHTFIDQYLVMSQFYFNIFAFFLQSFERELRQKLLRL